METEFQVLVFTAASIGFLHTLLGPDHYLPFLAIGKARGWNNTQMVSLTVLCGIGHVASSVLLGMLGVIFQWKLSKLVWFESFRGNLAAWFLIAFGLVYALWGFRHWYKHHRTGVGHHHHGDQSKSLTPWVLFIIFVLGPCEPLIPILMYPAANSSMGHLLTVVGVFSTTTISTMVLMVLLPNFLLGYLKINVLSRFSHVLAGFVIFLSGMAIEFLGL